MTNAYWPMQLGPRSQEVAPTVKAVEAAIWPGTP